jgi:uncharacterized protein
MIKCDVRRPDSWDGDTAIILAHGAGQGMDSPFMTYFHTALALRGFLMVRFNFEYMDNRRKIPDPQPKLQARYREVLNQVSAEYTPRRLIIGGKSMGGRVASYIAADVPAVTGLIFLGYPLHPPGRQNQLRDEHLYKISLPMLFISGTKDTFAERNLLDSVIGKIGERAKLIWIDGGDHSLKTRRRDDDSLATAVTEIEKWLAGLT